MDLFENYPRHIENTSDKAVLHTGTSSLLLLLLFYIFIFHIIYNRNYALRSRFESATMRS